MTGAVTIGMPIYNSAASLTMALQSVCSQSSSRIERILISDNCSTDATPSLLEDWVRRDPRIDVVRHPRNLGPILNFDFVARQAKTPLFMFAADDDAWSPAFVDKLWDALAAQPTATLAYPRVELMSSDMKTTTKFCLPGRLPLAAARCGHARLYALEAAAGFMGFIAHQRSFPRLISSMISATPGGMTSWPCCPSSCRAM